MISRSRKFLLFPAILLTACSWTMLFSENDGVYLQPTGTVLSETPDPIVTVSQTPCEKSLEKVIAHDGSDGRGKWSPDNRLILFDRVDGRSVRQIYVRDMATGVELPLTESELLLSGVGLGSWSPDGERIALDFQKTEGYSFDEPTRFYMAIEELEDLLRNPFKPHEEQAPGDSVIGTGFGPEWSPTRDEILFGYDPYENGQYYIAIFVLDLGTHSVTQLTSPEWRVTGGRWSPDGERIAFSSEIDGDYEIYTMNRDGSDIVQVTANNEFDEIIPIWSPSGRYLAFSTNRNGSWDIYALSLETGAEYQITNHPQNETISDWGSNDFILFSANWGSTDPLSTELPIVTPFDEIYMMRSCFEE